VWAAIRCFGKDHVFSVAEIMLLSGQRDDTALTYLRGLEKAGFVKALGCETSALRRRREMRRFHLVRDVGVDAPRVTGEGEPVEQGSGRNQMWQAVKVLKEFDYRALAAAASTEKHPVSPEEAQTYCRHLKLGGYLGVTRPAAYGTKGTSARYRFLRARNTGPRAPLISRQKEVIDANTGQLMYQPGEQR
jgi:hypothetical protein